MNASNSFYANHYNQFFAEHYDQFYSQKNYRAECDLIEEAAGRFLPARPQSILDVGCGTGGHAIELAKRHYKLTGIDLSSAMLGLAQEKASRHTFSHQPHFVQGDIRSFDTGQSYDAAIMMFAVIGYLNKNTDVHQGLKNIRRHLRQGALFVCDFWYGASVLTERPTDRVRVIEDNGQTIIRTSTTQIDTTNHSVDVRMRVWKMENDLFLGHSDETHHMRYYFSREFEFHLQQAGFELCQLSAFPTLDQPLTDQAWSAFSVARAI